MWLGCMERAEMYQPLGGAITEGFSKTKHTTKFCCTIEHLRVLRACWKITLSSPHINTDLAQTPCDRSMHILIHVKA
jgi:hypothetical protein